MKKLLSAIVACIGGVVLLYCGYAYFIAHVEVFGFHAMYPALVGVALLTLGIIIRQE